MLLDIEMKKDTLFVRPNGELDLGVADRFRRALDETIEKGRAKNLVINLTKVSFVDSSGLGVLLGRYKKLSRDGGSVFIVAPQPQVRKVLDLSGLLRIMNEYSNENEAMDKIG